MGWHPVVAVEIGKDGGWRVWGWLDVVLKGREKTQGAVRAPNGASRLIPSLRGSEKCESWEER